MDASAFLAESKRLVDRALERLLPREDEPPTTLHRAMRYSVFAGGKRLRPALALAAAHLGDLGPERTAPAAGALELVHTYSLIHDDLPAMDDDDLRRGKPTCHVVFGEAHAILAGDALLTLAFEVLALEPEGEALEGRRLRALVEVARAAGHLGMVGGQTADLEATGAAATAVAATGAPSMDPRAALEFIHARKTGALLGASVVAGAMLGGLGGEELERLRRFGARAGLAFQVADDVLDVEGSEATLGKTAGKDARAAKLTYPALYGVEASKREARRLADEADSLLEPLGEPASLLRALARFIVERTS